MTTFADFAVLLAIIVFVFALLPALLADRRWRRSRGAFVMLTMDASSRIAPSWHEDHAGSEGLVGPHG